MDSRRNVLIVAIMLLAGAASAVYSRSLNSPFVFDDSGSVADNRSIGRLWPLVGDAEHPGPLNPSKDLPTSGRPLVNFSLAVNYYFGQLNPVGYHVFNLIVHVLSALLVMAIVRRTLCLDYFERRFQRASGPLAFAVALLWAVHPLQTETVIYVTQRTELLVGFFYLATLDASLRYWGANSVALRNSWLALATLACLAGMACKEVMVTAPVIVLLFERTFISGSFRRALQKSWPLYVGLFLSWGLLFWLNHTGPRAESAGFHLGVSAYAWWLTQAKVLLLYLRLVFWPWPLSIHYEMPYLTTLGAAWPWLAPVTLLGIATLILLWRRSAIGFVGAWVFVILSPTLVVPIITEVAAERRMYLPLAALVVLVLLSGYAAAQKIARLEFSAEGGRKSMNRWPLIITVATAGFAALVLSIVSANRLAAYQDDLSLWQENVTHQPDDPIAHNNLANSLLKIGQTRDAVQQYERALQLRPNYSDAHANLGGALASEGRLPEAVEHCQEALRIKPDYPEAHSNLGVALARLGKLPEAITEFNIALQLKPDYFNARYNFGNALLSAGRAQEAAEQYQQAILLNPNDAQAHYNLANAWQKAGELPPAIQHYRIAVQLRPEYVEAYNNLGSALLQAGQLQEALEQFQHAVRLNPEHANGYANLAIAYAHLNRPAAAVSAAQKGLEVARTTGAADSQQRIEAWLQNYRASMSNSANQTASPELTPSAP